MRGGQGRCERRSKVFVKIQKKKIFFFWGGGRVRGGGGRVRGGVRLGRGGVGLGGQGRCEGEVKFL